MPLDSSTPLTITGVIATILSVIFAMASYMNSQKRQKAKAAKAIAAAPPRPSNELKHTHIVIPAESPFPPPAAEPVHYQPAIAAATADRSPPPPAPKPAGPPPAAVFKQLIARPGIPTATARKKSSDDATRNEGDYVWE